MSRLGPFGIIIFFFVRWVGGRSFFLGGGAREWIAARAAVVDAVGGFQVLDHLQVVLPGAGAFREEGHQHGGRGPGGEDDGLAWGEDVRGGLALDDYAGEVRVDGVAGRGGRAGVGDLLTGVFQAADGELGEDAEDVLGRRPGREGPAVEDALGQRDALVDDQAGRCRGSR